MSHYFLDNNCDKCGCILVEEQLEYMPWYLKIIGGQEYNKTNGERNAVFSKYCPLSRWWNVGHYSVTWATGQLKE